MVTLELQDFLYLVNSMLCQVCTRKQSKRTPIMHWGTCQTKVQQHGLLILHARFVFEALLSHLKGLFRGTRRIVAQIIKKSTPGTKLWFNDS